MPLKKLESRTRAKPKIKSTSPLSIIGELHTRGGSDSI